MKMFFKKRSYRKELLDLKAYTAAEYSDCLEKLGDIGRRLGCQDAMLRHISKVIGSNSTADILDVGCGGGDFAASIAKAFPHARIEGVDCDEEAIKYAKHKWEEIPNLSFHCKDIFQEDERQYDIVTSTLVCHHLTDEELKLFMRKSGQIAKKAILINDLHRHFLAYLLFYLTSPIFFPNRLIQSDGLLSIKRAFTYKDWKAFLDDFPHWKAKWHWPFRWIIRVDI